LQLSFIDWAVVALYLAFNLGIGLYYKSRAGASMDEFFLSGHNIRREPMYLNELGCRIAG
jgi:Na+/proline symporter